eukprot:m.208713 g.208713  ORF g.208713 m.208713 type:complete len:381 (-) comp53936_c0_seq2:143-1285(-)
MEESRRVGSRFTFPSELVRMANMTHPAHALANIDAVLLSSVPKKKQQQQEPLRPVPLKPCGWAVGNSSIAQRRRKLHEGGDNLKPAPFKASADCDCSLEDSHHLPSSAAPTTGRAASPIEPHLVCCRVVSSKWQRPGAALTTCPFPLAVPSTTAAPAPPQPARTVTTTTKATTGQSWVDTKVWRHPPGFQGCFPTPERETTGTFRRSRSADSFLRPHFQQLHPPIPVKRFSLASAQTHPAGGSSSRLQHEPVPRFNLSIEECADTQNFQALRYLQANEEQGLGQQQFPQPGATIGSSSTLGPVGVRKDSGVVDQVARPSVGEIAVTSESTPRASNDSASSKECSADQGAMTRLPRSSSILIKRRGHHILSLKHQAEQTIV